MSMMHWAMHTAATVLGTHAMIAGTDGGGPPENGYRVSSFGVMNPTTLDGFEIRSVSVGGTPTVFGVAVNGYAGSQTGLWTSITFQSSDSNWNGKTFLATDAAVYAGGSWLFGVEPLFIPGVTYNLEWV